MPLLKNDLKNLEIVSYVNKATLLVQKKGNSSFNEFYKTEWYSGDKYIFIWQMDGIRVVYPPDPNAINQNMTNLTDFDGKPIGKLFIETAQNGQGWVEYRWPKPNSKSPSIKLTYIKRAQYLDKEYLVGSGVYVN